MKSTHPLVRRTASLVLCLVLILGALPAAGLAQTSVSAGPPPGDIGGSDTTEAALQRIDPELRAMARKGGEQLVKVTVLVETGADLSRYFTKMLVRPGGGFDRVIGLVRAGDLVKIATLTGTYAILTMEARTAPAPAPSVAAAESAAAPERVTRSFEGTPRVALPRTLSAVADTGISSITAPESLFTNDASGVFATWALGITGDGAPDDPLKLAVIDTGVDFANPDLFGIQARVVDGVYFDDASGIGWPIAFDDRSMSDFALDIQDYRGNWAWYMSAALEIQDPDLLSNTPFTFEVSHPDTNQDVVYTIGSDIQDLNTNGGHYRFGWHPDNSLMEVLGETAGVLVTDENTAGNAWGEFDTVYVDMGPDYIFDTAADGWATLGQEIACVNAGASAPTTCDISAGMVYYVSNGSTPVPASDWIYGLGDVADPGAVVAFMLNDYTANTDHGTLCAGTAAGQGVIDMVPYEGTYGSLYWPPTWYDPETEAISLGPAVDASVVSMGDFYAGGSQLTFYDFTALGYDGIPAGAPGDTHDQPHIHSNSYGSGGVENDGWDLSSRYATLINRGYIAQQDIELPDGGAHSALFVGSTGNSGFGYGTVTSPQPETSVTVGTDTTFGQFNFGDTALYRNWVNWGQLGGFSNRGPASSSTMGAYVLANGFFGSGNLALNEGYGGDWSADSWSGTSRSSPEVMGILGLIYDAYYEEHGVYPSWSQARAYLMNGARTLYSDPLAQGAGRANALNAVQIIRGERGAQITSSEGDGFWIAGDYQDAETSGYARGLFAGESDTETFRVANAAGTALTLNLQPVTLEMTDSREWAFTSLPLDSEKPKGTNTYPNARYYDRMLYGAAGTSAGFGTTDPVYLSGTTDEALFKSADLLVIRMSYPFEQFAYREGTTATQGNWWFVYSYAWRDTDADGAWFTDVNNNDVRNLGEAEATSEMVRINYDYHGNTTEIRIREPWTLIQGAEGANEPDLAAMTAMLVSLRHFAYGDFDTTDLYVTFELYEEAPWTDVTLSTSQVIAPAGGATSFNATVAFPADQAPGDTTGYIKASYTTPYAYSQYIPVKAQVWFPSDVDPVLGGVDQPTLYDNGVVFGATGPSPIQRAESGDWRFFYTDIDMTTLAADMGNFLLAHTTWEAEGDAPNDTDIDTLFYGPTTDAFADWPEIFGPSGLTVIGGSMRAGSAPDWLYFTTSGGPDDWSSVKMDPRSPSGLHGVAAQVVRWGGERTTVPFQISVGTAQATESVWVGDVNCGATFPIVFKTNHADLVGQPLAALTYGFTAPVHEVGTVAQSEYFDYTYTITADDAYQLAIRTSQLTPGMDLDLEVYYVDGGEEVLVGYSGRADSEEQVVLPYPAAGEYHIAVYGYTVIGGTTDFDLYVEEISGEGAMVVNGLPTSIVAGELYEMEVSFATLPAAGLQVGVIFLGPAGSPLAVEIPVTVNGTDDPTPCYSVSKVANTTAVAGTNVSFDLTVENIGATGGTGIVLEDTFLTVLHTWPAFDLAAGASVLRSFSAVLPCTVVPVVNDTYGVVSANEPYATTAVLPVAIDVAAPTIVAAFNASAPAIEPGATLYVTSTSTTNGTPLSYAWNFGDGATASGPTASHSYPTGGTYIVTLTVTDGCGFTDSAQASVLVAALAPAYTVSKVAQTSGVAGTSVSFVLSVANTGTAAGHDLALQDTFLATPYDWPLFDLAAGATVTRSFGTLLPCTIGEVVNQDYGIVSSAEGITASGAPVTVPIVAPTLVADFDASATLLMVGGTLELSDASTTNGAAITARAWNFGDGSTATGMTATHTYTAGGDFTVTLTVTDTCGFSDSAQLLIRVRHLLYLPLATLDIP